MLPCAVGDLVGEGFNIVAAGPGIDLLGDHRLFLDIDLGVTGDTGAKVGRQCDSLVESVGVEALSVSQGGAHGFDTGASYVVVGILLGERPSRCLRVGAQGERFGVLRVELLDDLCPEHAGGAHLGDLHEEVHADSPEERQTRSELIDAHSGVDTGTQIFETVGQGIGQLDVGRSAGFLHVVSRNRDRVEFRHILRGELEDVGDNAHRELGRIDIGVAHHELLQNVVLDCTGHLVEFRALLKAGVDVEGEHGEHCAVHCHRNRHLIQRNTVEQNLHVFDRADRHAGFTYIAYNALMVGVVATVCSEVEGNRKAFLSRSKVAAVESVRFFCGRETGILANCPGAHGIHGAVGAAQERGQAGYIIEVFKPFEVVFGVDGLHGNHLGGEPVFTLGQRCVLVAESVARNIDSLKIGFHCYRL